MELMNSYYNNLKKDVYSLNYSLVKFKNLINECNVKDRKFALCLIDISNFKNYNYVYGYEFGNSVLYAVFNEIKASVGKLGYVCLYGGNVFLVILDKKTEKQEVLDAVTQIEDRLKKIFNIDDVSTKILINMGIALYPENSKNVENVLKCAEIALNYSKKLDLYTHSFFNHKMHNLALKNAGIEINLLKSSYEEDFLVYYQPEYDTSSMKIVGAEALIRWGTGSHGVLESKDFIKIAIKNGMENNINKVLIDKVCNQIKKLEQKGIEYIDIYVNVSGKLMMKKEFLERIKNIIASRGIDASKIVIEIPEKMLNRVDDRVIKVISYIRSMGIKVFLDDFGAKYSSLNHLMHLPVDGIKIDKAIVNAINKNSKTIVVFQNIMRMSRELNVEVIAKGVETQKEIEILKKMGCTKVQGFALGRPMDEKSFMELIDKP
ncbi:bifunctional diguanylate cyclase/phosphodiesterase [Clostridium acidisoli]|nr:bifunctional diguanylate cyclase/phosphodiesterase [Clostridium acidisoli]